MTTALDRTRALLDTPPPEPIPGQLDLTRSDMTQQPVSEAEILARNTRLEDGSTHTVAGLITAGEECVQRECMAGREENKLRQELYILRARVDGVLEQVADLVADGHVSTTAVAGVRQDLRDALGLTTP